MTTICTPTDADVLAWGDLHVRVPGVGRCAVCGCYTSNPPCLVVPDEHLGWQAGYYLENWLTLCGNCGAHVKRADEITKELAAALILRGPLRYPFAVTRQYPNRLSREALRQRDGEGCIICGGPPPNVAGHIVSRAMAKRWGLPQALYDDQRNVVVMCWGCNLLASWHVPPLRIGLRLLIKPWTWNQDAA